MQLHLHVTDCYMKERVRKTLLVSDSSVQIVFRKSRRLGTHHATSAMHIVKTTLLSLWKFNLF